MFSMPTACLAIRSAANNVTGTKPAKRTVVSEFADYFGNESTLANWQRLCADVGLVDNLPSIKKCRAALNNVFVNIFDLIDANKNGTIPRMFGSRSALAKYSLQNRKICPKKKAKQGGPVAALLIHVF